MEVSAQGEGQPADRRASLDVPFDSADPMFSSDEFRVFEMKIRRCPRARPHDWTLCPFAHPGEKAKRRDPRKFTYSGTACAEYRKSGQCARGDACTFSHGVFECHLHPSRYRTQLCTDGMGCRRRVCFFAHQECELRRLPEGTQLPGTASPAAQLQADFATEAALLQGQAQLAQALHSYIDLQTRARQEEAITAAAQLLDPLAKLRLLRALQDQTSLTPLSSLVDGNGGAEGFDPSLLAAMSALHMAPGNGIAAAAATASRHSIDSGYAGVSNVFSGAFTSATAPTVPASLPAAGRRSIDIGSLSRTIDPFATHRAALKSQASASANGDVTGAGLGADAALSGSQFLGAAALPMSSFAQFSQRRNGFDKGAAGARGSMFNANGSGNGVRSSVGGINTSSNSSTSSEAAERSTSCGASGLQSINELIPIRDDESSSISSVSAVARSVSAGSSLDASGKESASASGSGATTSSDDSSPPEVPRVMSFDNLLSELPRSSSQVNMVGLASLGIS